MIRIGQFLFRYRNTLFPLLIIGGIVLAHPRYPFGEPLYDIWLDCLGLLIGLAGQSLRILTIGYEYIRRGGKNGQVYADELITGGVFGHSRNPLYVGNILICLGVVVMINDPWTYLAGVVPILFFYKAIVAAEEAFLIEEFPETYPGYCRTVNRWLPNFTGFRRTTAGMRFNWQRVLVKEYNTTFAWLIAMLAVQIWELHVHSDAAQGFNTAVYSLLGAFAGLAYLILRFCKKSRFIKA